MVKDFKYIIKKILIGVGIALSLMYLKGGLLANVHALSCDEVNYTPFRALDNGGTEAIGNNTNLDVVFLTKATINNGVKVNFNDSDFIEIKVPLTYIYAVYQNNTIIDNPNTNTFSTTEYSYLTNQQPAVYLTDNTNNPNNNVWVQGWSDGSYYHFKYFKKSYKTNYVNITSLKFGVSNTPILNAQVTTWVYIHNYWTVSWNKCDSNQALENKIEENTQAVDNINNTLENSETDDPSSDITGMNNKIATNGSITQLLTLPITLYQSILNATTGSCSQFQLGSLYNHNLVLPCINLSRLLGSTLYNIIDILLCGSFILVFRKKMVDIFNHMTSLNDRGNELE